MLADNVFLKILDGTIPARIAFQDDLCLAFHDIHPHSSNLFYFLVMKNVVLLYYHMD